MSNRLVVLFVASLAIALVVAGCGGGSDEPAGVSKAEFIREANAICEQTGERIESEFAAYLESGEAERTGEANDLTNDEAAARVAEEILIPAMRQRLEKLRALGIQDGDERASALLEAFDEGIEKAEAHPERAVRDGTEAFGKSERLASEYGLDSC